MRLIDAERLREDLCIAFENGCILHIEDIDSIIEEQPTTERKRGDWVPIRELLLPHTGDVMIVGYKCSNCKKYHTRDTDFCPNCGADMREVRKYGLVGKEIRGTAYIDGKKIAEIKMVNTDQQTGNGIEQIGNECTNRIIQYLETCPPGIEAHFAGEYVTGTSEMQLEALKKLNITEMKIYNGMTPKEKEGIIKNIIRGKRREIE